MKLPLFSRKDSLERGRHLVASSDLQKNQLVLVERPLVALQSLDNVSSCLVCRHCRSWISCDSNTSWGLASGRISRQDVAQRAVENDAEEDAIVACRNRCGELYCCIDCRNDHWNSGHAFLCTGSIPESEEADMHPLLQFKIHAMQHNEVFLMVADAVVGMLLSPPFRDKMLDFSQTPWWQVATEPLLKSPTGLAEAAALDATLRRLCQESSTLLKQSLLLQLQQSHGGTLFHHNISQDHIEDICTADTFGRLIGSFEQNAIGIRQRNPLCRAVLDANESEEFKGDLIACVQQAGMIASNDDDTDEEDAEEGDDANAKVSNEATQQGDIDDVIDHSEYTTDELCHFLAGLEMDEQVQHNDLDDVFTPLDGTAMYATACKMNHSCSPNVVVLYKQQRSNDAQMPLVAYCVALRDIQEGEELCISYIDSSVSYSERQEALANYGFQCECVKCLREASAGDQHCELPEEVKDFDDEDLFGPDSDDDDDETNNDENDNFDGGSDGETALRLKREELDAASNKFATNTIPINVLAIACNYVIRVGTSVIETLPNDLSEMMQQCLESVQTRDFVWCCEAGAILKETLYAKLQENGSWPDAAHRQAYGCGALACSIGNLFVGSLLQAQVMLDKAFILGLPRDEISEFFRLVEYFANDAARGPCEGLVVNGSIENIFNVEEDLKRLQYPIPEASLDVTPEEFQTRNLSQSNALVFRSFAGNWSATSRWRDLNNLVSNHGHRVVPIELGTMMKSGGMKEQMMPFRSFVSSFLVPSTQKKLWTLEDATNDSSTIGYLAQHPLLDQIPELCNALEMCPRLCTSPLLHRNVWMGTGGTRTPLHYDSYDNLLVQIVGYKYVRVYDTAESDKLYTIRGGCESDVSAQGNMSAVNCELEDFEEHPLARDATYQEVYLGPGDCLFLPARMWHYVRSLSTSISVNYWW